MGQSATYNHRQARRSEGNTYTKSVGMSRQFVRQIDRQIGRHDLEDLSYLYQNMKQFTRLMYSMQMGITENALWHKNSAAVFWRNISKKSQEFATSKYVHLFF